MHIGIIELCEKNHHSMIFNWIKIANINKWKITLFTTKEVFKNVRSELIGFKYKVIIKNTNNLFYQIKINKIIQENKIDKIIYLTFCNHLVYLFAPIKSANFGITVHNANTWFNKNRITKLRHYLKRYIVYNVKKKSSFFILNSENMKKFVDESFRQSKPICVLPFSLRKNLNNNNRNKTFTTVYPSGINHLRRNYKNFIRLAKSNPNDKFIILGNTKQTQKDLNILSKIDKINNITVYDYYLNINAFNKIIKNSHLLFSDIKVNYISSDISEVYGKSKDSGISYLMNEFNLPCLINSDFVNFSELSYGTLYFNNYDKLYKTYNKVKNNKKYLNSLSKKIKNDTKSFNFNRFSKNLSKFFS